MMMTTTIIIMIQITAMEMKMRNDSHVEKKIIMTKNMMNMMIMTVVVAVLTMIPKIKMKLKR